VRSRIDITPPRQRGGPAGCDRPPFNCFGKESNLMDEAMRYLPRRGSAAPEGGLDPDFDDSLSPVMRETIGRGETALRELRGRTLDSWVAAGAAWKALQLAAMYRSNSNAPAGRRYNVAYGILGHPWPELAKIDKTTRKDAIWLFEAEDEVRFWLAAFPQNKRDRWMHPTVIRRNYEKLRPVSLRDPPQAYPPRPPRHTRKTPRRLVRREDLTREELLAHNEDLERNLADRDRTIIDQNEQLEVQRSRIAELENDKAWLQAENRQLKKIVTPSVVAEDARVSREIVPPHRFGKPDYGRWARLMAQAIATATTAAELEQLRADNDAHLEAHENEIPGAGVAVEDRISERISALLG
jgi:hypothetical protein